MIANVEMDGGPQAEGRGNHATGQLTEGQGCKDSGYRIRPRGRRRPQIEGRVGRLAQANMIATLTQLRLPICLPRIVSLVPSIFSTHIRACTTSTIILTLVSLSFIFVNPLYSAPLTLTFNDYPVGTIIIDQYRSKGIYFPSMPIINDPTFPTSPALRASTLAGFNTFGASFVNPNGGYRPVRSFSIDVGPFTAPNEFVLGWYKIVNNQRILIDQRYNTGPGTQRFSITSTEDIYSFSGTNGRLLPPGYKEWRVDNVSFDGIGTSPTPKFFYAGAFQRLSGASSAQAYFTIERPYLDPSDYHSLAELVVRSTDLKQVVEVGWTVDKALNGNLSPHLFVFYWVDGKAAPRHAGKYNEGFLCTTTLVGYCPGDELSPTKLPRRFAIQQSNGNWYIYVDNQRIGYFPSSLWGSGKFTSIGNADWFGEVSAGSQNPATDMGDGVIGTKRAAALINRMAYTNSAGKTITAAATKHVTKAQFYTVGFLNGNSFRYGGPGAR